MGLTPEQHAKQHAALNPPPTSQPEEAKPELITEDATIGNEERLRGIPARDILHNHLNRHRYRKDQA